MQLDSDMLVFIGMYVLSLVTICPASILKSLGSPQEDHISDSFIEGGTDSKRSEHTAWDDLDSRDLKSLFDASDLTGENHESSEEKRAFQPWSGKRVFQPWSGKRAFNPWNGKRAFQPWSGKRSAESDQAEEMNGLEEDIDSKRAFNPWNGKRAFNAWAGKRGFNAWAGKRAFNAWAGKRAFNPWNGKRVFNAWAGKRSSMDPADDQEMRQLADDSDLMTERRAVMDNIHEQERAAFNSWAGKREAESF